MNPQASNFFALSALNIRPWNVESLESTNNSPLALEQRVAKATVQMKRRMREREQRELEREKQMGKRDQNEKKEKRQKGREGKYEDLGEDGKRQENNVINIPIDLEIFVQL